MGIRLSVVVPVYQVKAYLERCVDSAVASDAYRRGELELLLVDDGSPDDSGALCDCLAQRYAGITVIHRENGGLSAARNSGIEAAQGEYLLFLDADDRLTDGAIDRVMSALESQPDVLILNHMEQDAKTGVCTDPPQSLNAETVSGLTGEALLSYLVTGRLYHWYAWRNVVRRAFLTQQKLLFTEGREFEDVLWTPAVLYAAQSVAYLDEPSYVYVTNRSGSITRAVTEKSQRDKRYTLQFMTEFCEQHGLSQDTAQKLMGNLSQVYVSLLADAWMFPKAQRREQLQELKAYTDCLRYATQRYKRWLYRALPVISLSGVSRLLYARAQYVRRTR